MRLLVRATNILEEYSQVDSVSILKLIELRINIVNVVVSNNILLSKWYDKVEAYSKTTSSLFEDLKNISDFNEEEIPFQYKFLSSLHSIQEILIIHQHDIPSKINKILSVFQTIENDSFQHLSEKNVLFQSFSIAIFETLKKSSWEKNSSFLQNKQELTKIFQKKIIVDNLFEILEEKNKIFVDSSPIRILLIFVDLSSYLKEKLQKYFSTLKKFRVEDYISGVVEDKSINIDLNFLNEISNKQIFKITSNFSSNLTEKSLSLLKNFAPNAKKISLGKIFFFFEC